MSATGLRQDAARGVAWTTIQAVGARSISFVVFVVLARLVAPRDFGVVALATVAIALMTLLVEQGFGPALVQRRDLRREHEDTAFWIIVLTASALAATLALAAGPIAYALNEPRFAPVLRALALCLPIGGLGSVPQALFLRDLAFRFLAERAIAANLVGGGVGIAAALLGLGVWSLVLQTLFATLASTGLLLARTSYRPGLAVSRAHFHELVGFSLHVLGSNLFNFLSRNSDDFLIGAVLGPVPLGFYSVAYKVLLVMTDVLTRTIQSVSFPVFARVSDDIPRFREGYLKATQLCAMVSFPTFALVALLAPEIVRVVFGPRWDAATPVMQALAAVGIVQAFTFFTGAVLLALGRARWLFWYTGLNAACNVAAFAVSVHWGILAVAISFSARAYLLAPVAIVVVKRMLGFSSFEFLRNLAAPAAATVATIAAVLVLKDVLLGGAAQPAALAGLLAFAGPFYLAALRLSSPELTAEALQMARLGVPSLGRRKAPQPAGSSSPPGPFVV